MGDSKGAAAFISDGAAGSPQTLTGVEIRRCTSLLLANSSGRPFGARSGRRAGAGGVPTISGTTVTIPAGAAVVDAGGSLLDSPFLVSWGSAVPTVAGTPADSSQPRVDVVYVRVDEVLGSPTTQTITFGYQAGTAAANPQPPTTVGVDNLPIARVAVLGYVNVPAAGSAASVTAGPVVVAAGGSQPVNGATADYPSNPYRGQLADDPVEGLQRWNGSVWTNPDPRGDVGGGPAVSNTLTDIGNSNGLTYLQRTFAARAGRLYKASAYIQGTQQTAASPIVRATLVDNAGLIADGSHAIYYQNLAVGTVAFGQIVKELRPSTTRSVTVTLECLANGGSGALRVQPGVAQLFVEDVGRA